MLLSIYHINDAKVVLHLVIKEINRIYYDAKGF